MGNHSPKCLFDKMDSSTIMNDILRVTSRSKVEIHMFQCSKDIFNSQVQTVLEERDYKTI